MESKHDRDGKHETNQRPTPNTPLDPAIHCTPPGGTTIQPTEVSDTIYLPRLNQHLTTLHQLVSAQVNLFNTSAMTPIIDLIHSMQQMSAPPNQLGTPVNSQPLQHVEPPNVCNASTATICPPTSSSPLPMYHFTAHDMDPVLSSTQGRDHMPDQSCCSVPNGPVRAPVDNSNIKPITCGQCGQRLDDTAHHREQAPCPVSCALPYQYRHRRDSSAAASMVRLQRLEDTMQQHQLEFRVIKRALFDEQMERQRDCTALESHIIAMNRKHQLAIRTLQREFKG
jgi:hypothetical protein